MPLFEYVCPECAEEKELNVSIAERDEQTCKCGHKLKRRVVFKGSVWAPTATNGGHK